MVTKKAVEDFLAQKRWAFVGVSENKKKFGGFAYKELKKKGLDLIPVNHKLDKLDGETVYPSLSALPSSVDAVIVSVSPTRAAKVIREAIEQGINHIWLQQGAESPEAIKYCKDKGVNVIHGECIMMFAQPVGFPHSFHRLIWKLVGKIPK